MNRSDFTVGQTVYLKTISHLRKCWEKERIEEATVINVGRKYVTVTLCRSNPNLWKYQFDIGNNFVQKSNYTAEYKLFLTKQDIFDYWQSEYLRCEIENTFSRCFRNISLEALKEIAQVLFIPVDYKKEGTDHG